MTGFGEASTVSNGWQVRVEIRSVNNRHLKVSLRAEDALQCFEAELERLVRAALHRGTVQVSIESVRPSRADVYKINQVALRAYLSQVTEVLGGPIPDPSIGSIVAGILALPGWFPNRHGEVRKALAKTKTGPSFDRCWMRRSCGWAKCANARGPTWPLSCCPCPDRSVVWWPRFAFGFP